MTKYFRNEAMQQAETNKLQKMIEAYSDNRITFAEMLELVIDECIDVYNEYESEKSDYINEIRGAKHNG